MKFKEFYMANETVNQMDTTTTTTPEWERNSLPAMYLTGDSYPKYTENQTKHQENQQPDLKMCWWAEFSRRKYKTTNVLYSIQHHWLLGAYKLDSSEILSYSSEILLGRLSPRIQRTTNVRVGV